MQTKRLNAMWTQWNAGSKTERFGQFVMNNSIIEHLLGQALSQKVWDEVNPSQAYNYILMICED